MGSGEAASAASELCAAFLERMLSAGSHVEISVRMLNSFLCARGNGSDDECSVTVDLMELDTACGHAVFAKNGAAPTYVIRDGTVYKLRSRSLPLGILHDSAPQFLRFRMHPGDVVVMVSDGVTLGNDECPWLLDLLSALWTACGWISCAAPWRRAVRMTCLPSPFGWKNRGMRRGHERLRTSRQAVCAI